jgi:hypothetical protein
LAGLAGDDGEEAPGSRYITDLDRLEEYSAHHAETFDELGEWPADRFEAAWDAYRVRSTLDQIERDRKDMAYSLYANGMIGGQELTRELNAITARSDALRAQVLDPDLVSEDVFSDELPMPTEGLPPDAA